MKTRLFFLILILALMLPATSAHAQKESSNLFAFEDGTTIQYPDGWNVWINEFGNYVVESAHTQILISLNPSTAFTDYNVVQGDFPALLADMFRSLSDSEGQVNYAEVDTIQLGSYTYTRFISSGQDQYGTYDHWTMLTQLNNGIIVYASTINIDGSSITEETAVHTILSSFNETNSIYTLEAVDLTHPNLDESYTFGDGSIVSFPTDWETANTQDQGYEAGVFNADTYIVFDRELPSVYTDENVPEGDLNALLAALFGPIGSAHVLDPTHVYSFRLGDHEAVRYDYRDIDTAGVEFDRIILLTEMENGTVFYIAITPRNEQRIVQRQIALQIVASLTAGTAPAPTPVPPTATPITTTTQTVPDAVLFSDDFSSPSSGWEVGVYGQGSVGYGSGDYVVTSTQVANFMWGVANQNFTDVAIEVDTVQVAAPTNNNNGYGVMCRVQANGDGYALRISGDGWASIHKIINGVPTVIVDWIQTPLIVQGNSANHLRAICSGSNLALHVNGTLVAEAQDSTYTAGDIAFIVTSFEAQPSEIHFDNLVVSSPTVTTLTGLAGLSSIGDSMHQNISPTEALFEDDFSDAASGWEVGNYQGGSVGYVNGAYSVTSTAANGFMWGVANQNFADIDLEMDTTQIYGPTNNNNGFGVICRLQANNDGYFLLISGDGYASIYKRQRGSFTPLMEWVESSRVIQGNSTNHLRAVCSGTSLQLYVNGELVIETTDSTFTSGDISLIVLSYDDGASEVHFDNLVVNAP